jgi:polar amino acid transport system permease protein
VAELAGILAVLGRGAAYTAAVTLACAATGMSAGLAAAGLRRSGVAPLVWAVDAFAYVFRGLPVLVLLFLVYFGLPGLGFSPSPILAMMLSLGLIAGAYLSEVFRGAFDSVDAGEILAAEAAGMTRVQILVYIELPQMLRFAVPGMLNELTTILKYSPFAYTVGIPEITKRAMNLASTTLRGVEIYLAAGVLYFAIYRLLSEGVARLERRFRVPGFEQLRHAA